MEMVAWLWQSSACLSPKYRSLISLCLAAAQLKASESSFPPPFPQWGSWGIRMTPSGSLSTDVSVQIDYHCPQERWKQKYRCLSLLIPILGPWTFLHEALESSYIWPLFSGGTCLRGKGVPKASVAIKLGCGKFIVGWAREWSSAWLHCPANVEIRAVIWDPAHSQHKLLK